MERFLPCIRWFFSFFVDNFSDDRGEAAPRPEARDDRRVFIGGFSGLFAAGRANFCQSEAFRFGRYDYRFCRFSAVDLGLDRADPDRLYNDSDSCDQLDKNEDEPAPDAVPADQFDYRSAQYDAFCFCRFLF